MYKPFFMPDPHDKEAWKFINDEAKLLNIIPKFPPMLQFGCSKLNDARHVNLTDEELDEDYGKWMEHIREFNRLKHMNRHRLISIASGLAEMYMDGLDQPTIDEVSKKQEDIMGGDYDPNPPTY